MQNGKKDLILIDVVEVVYKKPLQYLRSNDYNIKAILTTGKGVKNNCYANSQTIAEDAGSADIHIHPDIAPQDQETKELIGKSELLDNFGLEAMEFSGKMAQSSSIATGTTRSFSPATVL